MFCECGCGGIAIGYKGMQNRFIHGHNAYKGSPESRFWAKVNKDGPIPEYAPHLGPCWLWEGTQGRRGKAFYGIFGVGSKADGSMRSVYAHRFSYELGYGPVPDGLEPDHLCRVTLCVNWSHLEAVTHQVNMLRGYGVSGNNARKTHCLHGHRYTPENTYVRPDGTGWRQCRECIKRRTAEWGKRRKRPRCPKAMRRPA